MAVNLTNAESALKSVYLDVISDQLNNYINPFYAAIAHNTTDVVGKDVKKLVIDGLNGGVGAGEEDGNLPKAKGNKYVQFVTPLKNLYGVIEISDKAVRASQNNAGAFVNLLNAEMEGLLKASQFNFGRMLFGDGSGLLATIPMATESELILSTTEKLTPGITVDIVNSDGSVIEGYQGVRVSEVDHEASTIKLDGKEASELLMNARIYVNGTRGGELTGLEAIFDKKRETLYGVNRKENSLMNPMVKEVFGSFEEIKFQKVLDDLEVTTGSKPNMILCSLGVKRAIQSYFKDNGQTINTMELAGGYKTISYNGIPIVADRFCARGNMYLLNTEDFALHQLCDWEWLAGEDDRILRQVPGKPVYTATLVKYAELICNRPKAQCLLKGVSEE